MLRTTVIVAALLCLLVPLAATGIWPPLPQEAISGTAGSAVAGWSLVLWLVALALGWSCLLAGTAAASRLAFVPSLAHFIYFPWPWWQRSRSRGGAVRSNNADFALLLAGQGGALARLGQRVEEIIAEVSATALQVLRELTSATAAGAQRA